MGQKNEENGDSYIMKEGNRLKENLLLLEKRNLFLEEMIRLEDMRYRMIFHDMKNPLAAILGFLDIMNGKDFDLTDIETVKKYNGIILKSSKSFFDLLLEVIPNNGGLSSMISINPKAINVSILVVSVLERNIIDMKKKDIQIKSSIDQRLMAYIDSAIAKSILSNILHNAIKFSHNKGEITINARLSNSMIFISVSDNGIGIPEHLLSNLFSGKLKSRLGTNGEKGTGFGLIATKFFVEKCGGTIDIISKKDRGTTVTFSIPESSFKQN